MAVAPQISITDANGASICFVRQKMFKLREKIEVFTDPKKTTVLAIINADRIIDFSATYTISDPQGLALGQVRRKGMRSIWKCHYEIEDALGNFYALTESNPMVKVIDGFFSAIPILGGLSGYVFQPRYEILDSSGQLTYLLTKEPAFFEGKFRIEKKAESDDDVIVLLSILMAILLERRRG
ncbi:MAG: hypothetical protein ACFCU4_05820 [Puniceicoccaceae bacterium]